VCTTSGYRQYLEESPERAEQVEEESAVVDALGGLLSEELADGVQVLEPQRLVRRLVFHLEAQVRCRFRIIIIIMVVIVIMVIMVIMIIVIINIILTITISEDYEAGARYRRFGVGRGQIYLPAICAPSSSSSDSASRARKCCHRREDTKSSLPVTPERGELRQETTRTQERQILSSKHFDLFSSNMVLLLLRTWTNILSGSGRKALPGLWRFIW
jgi:transposase-like protein